MIRRDSSAHPSLNSSLQRSQNLFELLYGLLCISVRRRLANISEFWCSVSHHASLATIAQGGFNKSDNSKLLI